MATNFSSAAQSALSGGRSSIFGTGATLADLISARNLASAGRGLDAAHTISELESSIADAERALEVQRDVQTAVDVAAAAKDLHSVSRILGKDLPSTGEVATGALTSMAGKTLPGAIALTASSFVPEGFRKYDPVARTADLVTTTVDKIPGVSAVNRGITAVGDLIGDIPGAETASRIAGVGSQLPDFFLKGIGKALVSPFSSAGRESEYVDKVAALKEYLRPLVLNNQLSTEDLEGHEIGNVPYLRASPEQGYMPHFQATSNFPEYKGMTVRELRQTPEGKEAFADLASIKTGEEDVRKYEAADEALEQDLLTTDPFTGERLPGHKVKAGLMGGRLFSQETDDVIPWEEARSLHDRGELLVYPHDGETDWAGDPVNYHRPRTYSDFPEGTWPFDTQKSRGDQARYDAIDMGWVDRFGEIQPATADPLAAPSPKMVPQEGIYERPVVEEAPYKQPEPAQPAPRAYPVERPPVVRQTPTGQRVGRTRSHSFTPTAPDPDETRRMNALYGSVNTQAAPAYKTPLVTAREFVDSLDSTGGDYYLGALELPYQEYLASRPSAATSSINDLRPDFVKPELFGGRTGGSTFFPGPQSFNYQGGAVPAAKKPLRELDYSNVSGWK